LLGVAALLVAAACLGWLSAPQTTFVVALVLIVASLPLIGTRPSMIIGLAIILVWTSRLLTVVGAAPRFLDFIDFPLVIAAFVLAGIHFLSANEVLPAAHRKICLCLTLFAGVIGLSWFFHNLYEPQRLVAGWILALEPFLLLLAVLLAPMTSNERRTLLTITGVLLCSQVAFSAVEFLAGNVGDDVKGTLLKTGAGHHVSAGGGAVGFLIIARHKRIPRALAIVYGVVSLFLIVVADAKQVLFALPAALLVLGVTGGAKRSLGPLIGNLLGGILMAVTAVIAMALYSATSAALDFITRSFDNDTGKLAVLTAVWNDMSDSAPNLLFGLGPGETVSRFAFLTTPGLFREGTPVQLLGLSVSRGADRYQAIAQSGAYNGGNSSFNGAQSSLLGILGDYGLVGFGVFVALVVAIIRALLRAERSSIRATALAGWTMLIPLAIVFDWLEQPPFTLAVMLITGLALRERRHDDPRLAGFDHSLSLPPAFGTGSMQETQYEQSILKGYSMSPTERDAPTILDSPNHHGTLVHQENKSSPSATLTLGTYLGMVWRRKFLVLAVSLCMAVPAYVSASLQTPVYRSSAQFLITQTALDANYNASGNDLTDSEMSDEVALITGPTVAARAAQLGATSTVTASKAASSHVVTVAATGAVPAAAAATVRAYVQAYSEQRQERAQSGLSSAIDKLRSRIDDLQGTINRALPQDRSILQQQQLRFVEQVTRLDIQRGVTSWSGTIVREADVPTIPFAPTPQRDAMLALVIGIVLGLSVAVLTETLRNRRRSTH